MAFSDPQTVTINAVPITLPRTITSDSAAGYTAADGNTTFTISHVSGKTKRRRSSVRLDIKKITPDPFVPTTSIEVSHSVFMVSDRPGAGFTNTEIKDAVVALATWLTASSAANTVKVLGGES